MLLICVFDSYSRELNTSFLERTLARNEHATRVIDLYSRVTRIDRHRGSLGLSRELREVLGVK
jgi:hypothetical protein